jgi:Flp pilus assembly pilin Flp
VTVLRALMRDESGSAMTEYAIIVALFSAGAAAMLIAIASSSSNAYNGMTGQLQGFELGAPP